MVFGKIFNLPAPVLKGSGKSNKHDSMLELPPPVLEDDESFDDQNPEFFDVIDPNVQGGWAKMSRKTGEMLFYDDYAEHFNDRVFDYNGKSGYEVRQDIMKDQGLKNVEAFGGADGNKYSTTGVHSPESIHEQTVRQTYARHGGVFQQARADLWS